MKVAVIQSNYIPWKGYFDIIHDADMFIFYDDVQYTKNDWRNRNKVKSANGLVWLTVPTGTALDRLICEVTLADTKWAIKHWKTIEQSYSHTPHFARYRDFFVDAYLGRKWTSLSALNQYLITSIATEFLGITSKLVDSRAFAAEGKQLDRLLDLLVRSGASSYISGPSATDYIEVHRFAEKGIDLSFKSYDGYPEYPQHHPPFVHALSILDLLFHMGPDSPHFIWGWRDKTR